MAFSDSQANAQIFYGEIEGQVILSSTVKKGDGVGYSSGWKAALSHSTGQVHLRCVAAEDGVTGQAIKVYFGPVLMGGGRFTGATANDGLYVASATAGTYTTTAPTTTLYTTTRIGTMLTPTLALITPNYNYDTIHA